MFKEKVVVVTGGASGIGAVIANYFEKEGAKVCIFDIQENPYFVGDLSRKKDLEVFHEKVINEFGRIDCLIHNAAPLSKGLHDCTYEEFTYALQVGVTAPFILSQLFADSFVSGGSIINISSTRATMSQPFTESYTAAKGGISALTHGLAMSFAGRVRVNGIAPGWIDTTGSTLSELDLRQHATNSVGTPDDIAELVLFLCSEKAKFITGQILVVDGGMTKQMIYHDDCGWKLGL